MKYKVGDEVLVRVKIIGCSENGVYDVMANRANILETSLIDKIHIREDDIVQDQDMTAEEAWEIAKKLFAGYSDTELDEIFGKGWSYCKLMEFTPYEAKAKIEAWEQEKKIRVGDEVEITYSGNKFFVSQIDSDNQGFLYNGFDKNFGIYHDWARNQLKKTGRHIDFDKILEQIGVDE